MQFARGNASGQAHSNRLVVLFLRSQIVNEGEQLTLEQLNCNDPRVDEAQVTVLPERGFFYWNHIRGHEHDCSCAITKLRHAGVGPAVIGVLRADQPNFDALLAEAQRRVDAGEYSVVRNFE